MEVAANALVEYMLSIRMANDGGSDAGGRREVKKVPQLRLVDRAAPG
jgi:hypothetical protein